MLVSREHFVSCKVFVVVEVGRRKFLDSLKIVFNTNWTDWLKKNISSKKNLVPLIPVLWIISF